MELSPRQENILAFIKRFSDEHGYPPTIREIGEAVSISSTSVVNYNLNVLQEKGYIQRDREISRGVKLVEKTELIDADAVGTPNGLVVRVPCTGPYRRQCSSAHPLTKNFSPLDLWTSPSR